VTRLAKASLVASDRGSRVETAPNQAWDDEDPQSSAGRNVSDTVWDDLDLGGLSRQY